MAGQGARIHAVNTFESNGYTTDAAVSVSNSTATALAKHEVMHAKLMPPFHRTTLDTCWSCANAAAGH